jgi:uncharacterized RDD family membrane protein YckC
LAEPRKPTPGGPEDDDSGLTGMLGRAGAAALRPMRKVAGAGKEVLNDEAERALDGVMAGPLPEAVGRSIVEHHVVERVVSSALDAKRAETGADGLPVDLEAVEQALRRALDDPAVERMLKETIDSRLTAELADAITKSPAFKRTLTNVLSSPEVRHALERQTVGFGADMAAAARRKTRKADGGIEAGVWRLAGRRPDAERARYGGLFTRGLGFAIDLLFTQLIYLILGALIGLVTSIFGTLQPTWLVGTLAGIGGILVIGLYFVVFWSTAGQTPGMRIMRLRVYHAGEPPAIWRSVLRLIGIPLAIIPFFAGVVPMLFDPERRALPDYLGGTNVVYELDDEDEEDQEAEQLSSTSDDAAPVAAS